MRRVRIVAIVVMLTLALVVTMATSSSSDSGSNNGTGPKSVQAGGSHPATADVEISGCAADTSTGWYKASLTVTNHTSKQSNYLITVAFESPDGETQYDTAPAAVQNLQPGQSAQTDATSAKDATAGFTCKVAEVTRLAA